MNEKDVGYAISRLLFYTVPTDRALIGWQPFAVWSDGRQTLESDWSWLVGQESQSIANYLGDELAATR